MFSSVSVCATLLGILEPVDTDYSGGGLRGWLRALSRGQRAASQLLSGMAASSVCSAVIVEPPFAALCCVEMFPLAFDKKSLLCNLVHLLCPSCFFQHADFMPASLAPSLSLSFPGSSAPPALLECCGEIKKRPRSEQVRVFRFFFFYINDLLFPGCKHEG